MTWCEKSVYQMLFNMRKYTTRTLYLCVAIVGQTLRVISTRYYSLKSTTETLQSLMLPETTFQTSTKSSLKSAVMNNSVLFAYSWFLLPWLSLSMLRFSFCGCHSRILWFYHLSEAKNVVRPLALINKKITAMITWSTSFIRSYHRSHPMWWITSNNTLGK